MLIILSGGKQNYPFLYLAMQWQCRHGQQSKDARVKVPINSDVRMFHLEGRSFSIKSEHAPYLVIVMLAPFH